MLDDMANRFKGTANIEKELQKELYTSRSMKAKALIQELKNSPNGKISQDLALKVRRFIDRMRSTKSYTIDPSLSNKQAEFKMATDLLRKKLSDSGLGNLMNEERIFIEAYDNILNDAIKRQNRNVLGLFDLIAGGGGMASGNIAGGVTAALLVRAFQQPLTITNLAQALWHIGKLPNAQHLLKTIPPILNQLGIIDDKGNFISNE